VQIIGKNGSKEAKMGLASKDKEDKEKVGPVSE